MRVPKNPLLVPEMVFLTSIWSVLGSRVKRFSVAILTNIAPATPRPKIIPPSWAVTLVQPNYGMEHGAFTYKPSWSLRPMESRLWAPLLALHCSLLGWRRPCSRPWEMFVRIWHERKCLHWQGLGIEFGSDGGSCFRISWKLTHQDNSEELTGGAEKIPREVVAKIGFVED